MDLILIFNSSHDQLLIELRWERKDLLQHQVLILKYHITFKLRKLFSKLPCLLKISKETRNSNILLFGAKFSLSFHIQKLSKESLLHAEILECWTVEQGKIFSHGGGVSGLVRGRIKLMINVAHHYWI